MADNVINMKAEFDKRVHEQLEAQQKKQNESFDKLMENLNAIQNSSEANELGIEALMQIPDEAFAQISPVFLDTIEKEFSSSNQLNLMIQQMNARGDKLEDVLAQFDDVIEKMDTSFVGILSPVKRDFFKQMVLILKNKLSEAEGIAKRTIAVPVELCHPDAVMPEYARLGDAGMDVRAMEEYTIQPGETVLVSTGIKMAIPKGYAILVQPRSGMSYKTKLRVANTPGLIDSGYRDEIKVIIENIEPAIKDITYDFDDSGKPVITSILHGAVAHIEKGERIAQIRLVEAPCMACAQVDNVSDYGANRGGGFGSTGTHEVEPRTELDDELDMAEAMATMLKLESEKEKENEDVQGIDN
jgi:dUTP pyrophosphatase